MGTSRTDEFHSSLLAARLQPTGKHKSQGPPGSLVYNPTKKKEGFPGKHARDYESSLKTYNTPGKHAAGYTGKRRKSDG